MATTKVRNISGKDREVPLPDGQVLSAPVNHQVEVEADLAKSLLEQADNWERVKDAPKEKE